MLVVPERVIFFIALRATKSGSGGACQRKAALFLFFWNLEMISPGHARGAHYIWQNQKITATCLIFIHGVLATVLQSEPRPWLPSLQSWISDRAGSLPRCSLSWHLGSYGERHPHPWGSAWVPDEDGTPRAKCDTLSHGDGPGQEMTQSLTLTLCGLSGPH